MVELRAYSGLIRNHVELARELGVDIAGLSRREREERLLIAAYEEWGSQMGAHLNGQFGLALYDDATGTLFATRDPLGAELLFYYPTSDGRLLVATQIADLFGQLGFERKLNGDMIQFFLAYNYVPGEDTLFDGVYKLEPGGFLTFDGDEFELGRFWELAFDPDETKSLDDWADEIVAAMEASLHDITDEDETPDSFLSGGVDSSYILAKSQAKTGYCVAYADQRASEEEQARATAKHFGRDFKGIEVTPQEFFANVDDFLRAYEQPSADPAGLALFCAAKRMAAAGNVEVCFSGEGADEFFAGYSVYGNAARVGAGPDPVYCGSTYIMNEAEQRRFLKDYCVERDTRAFAKERGAGGRRYDTLTWMLYTELRTYFEGSIMFNSTRIAHGTGLDIRMPYCDLRMFDIALRMPSRFKYGPDGNKIALRAAAARTLPHEIAYRKKLGFPVPVRSWLADPRYNADIVRAFDSPTAARFFDVDEIGALLDAFLGGKPRKSHPVWFGRRKGNLWRYVWTIYIFIRWYELFFEDEAPRA